MRLSLSPTVKGPSPFGNPGEMANDSNTLAYEEPN